MTAEAITSRPVIATLAVPGCRCLRISPDGTSVLTVGNGIVAVHDALDGHIGWSRPQEALAELPVEAVWGAGGDTITLLTGGRLSRLDAVTGTDLPVPDEITGRQSVTAVALSPSGLTLAVGTRQGIILLWQQDTGRVIRLRGGGDPVTALAWRSNGNEMCVARPRSIQFWNPVGQTMISAIDAADTYPLRLAWAPDGSLIAVAGLRDVRMLSVSTRSESVSPLAVGGRPLGLGFSRTGSTLLVGLPTGSIQMLDRQLRPMEFSQALPADLGEAACLHVNEVGLVAMRRDSATVILFTLPDTILPEPGQRTAVALRRWAAGIAHVSGRAGNDPIPLAVPTTIAGRSHFAWADDGWVVNDPAGNVARYTGDGQQYWTAVGGPGGLSVQGRFVAISGADGVIAVRDLATGIETGRVSGEGQVSWHGDDIAVAAPGRRDLLVYDTALTDARRAGSPEGLGDPAWSPNGDRLAAVSTDGVVLWNGSTLERLAQLDIGSAPRLGAVEWSPDGRRLAVDPRGGPVTVWNTDTWRLDRPLAPSMAAGRGRSLAWSPDSRLLAIASPQSIGAIDLWDVRTGRIAMTVTRPPEVRAPVFGLDWARDGRFAVIHDDGTVIGWEFTLPSAPSDERETLPYPASVLATLGAATAATGTMVSLPLLADLLSLLLGHDAGRLAEFDRHPAVAMLRSLRWPVDAVIGLAVLIASGLPAGDGEMPPAGAHEEEMRAAIEQALDGVSILGGGYRPPLAELIAEFDRVDDSVLVLATLLGPDAVAAEPGLLARTRGQSFGGWSFAPRQRRLLGLRSMLTSDGSSQGKGIGDTRAGISRNGELPSLLPSQLALPRTVLAAKKSRDELLFRTRQGNLTVEAQPVVLLLDDTPAAFGAVGVTLRVVGNLLAAIAIRRHRRCAMVTLGSPAIRFLDDMADLVHLWSSGNVVRPNLTAALGVADSAAAQLSSQLGGLPRLVLLTHPYLASPNRPGLHIVRVRYPGVAAEDTAPRTHMLDAGAGPEQIHEAIGGILTDWT